MIVRLAKLLSLSVAIGATALFLGAQSASAEIPSPPDTHIGVSSCAGAPCHGSVQNTGKKINGVLQNEYLTWQRSDKHAKAFSVLQGDLSKRIARNLGLPSAEKAEICLDCHADNIRQDLRGIQYQQADGVGCEACHGGAQRWLGPHATGKLDHKVLVSEYGMYPTDRPVDRAKLCMNCHFGDANRFVTHKIMGAGHPRLVFELQTFTQIEPAHFQIDDIYRKRKRVYKGVQVWAAGQAISLQRMVTELQNPKRKGEGAFPELVFFDCHACHHPMSNLRWEKRESTMVAPGIPHFNDANAVMLKAIAARVSPELGNALQKEMLGLHLALSQGQGNAQERARAIGEITGKLADQLGEHEYTREDMQAMLSALVAAARAGDTTDYVTAEQTTMAISSIISTLNQDGVMNGTQYAALKLALDQCYAATNKEELYEPKKFVAAMAAVSQALPNL